jgi:hypothetical protein
MGGTRWMSGGEETHTGFWWGNLKERNNLEDLGLRWQDNVKMDLQDVGWEGVIGLIYLRIGTSARLL